MRIDPAGWPFVFGALIFSAIFVLLSLQALGAALLVLAGFFLFFFRDPDRRVTTGASLVLSPADGRVMAAGPPTGEATPPGSWQQITIFLSPMDVHVNRMPLSGEVRRVTYRPGRFLPAYRREAGDLNEQTEVWVDHGGTTIVVRQVVGVLARRIVCRLKEGDKVEAGQRFGVMKFGSRMDVFVPPTSALATRVGDRVVGGVSVIAELR
jgi:phosphatidylserine decarboxylase